MDGSYRVEDAIVPLRDDGRLAQVARLGEQVRSLGLRSRKGSVTALAQVANAVSMIRNAATPVMSRIGPLGRAHLTFLGIGIPDEAPAEPSPAEIILAEFEGLDAGQQASVGRNLALLWECFVQQFNGVSGFHQSPATQQAAYLDKLEAAAKRMETSRASEARPHYVCVALMWRYVSSFQTRSAESSDVRLSRLVAELIDGHR